MGYFVAGHIVVGCADKYRLRGAQQTHMEMKASIAKVPPTMGWMNASRNPTKAISKPPIRPMIPMLKPAPMLSPHFSRMSSPERFTASMGPMAS